MAFPTTPIREDFGLLSTGALPATNWLSPITTASVAAQIFNGVAVGPASAFGSGYLKNITAQNTEAWTKISPGASSFGGVYVFTRIAAPNTVNVGYYGCQFRDDGHIFITRQVLGANSGTLLDIASGQGAGNSVASYTYNDGSDIIVQAWSDLGSGYEPRGFYRDVGAIGLYPQVAGQGFFGFSLFGGGFTDPTRALSTFGGGPANTTPDETPFPTFGRGATW